MSVLESRDYQAARDRITSNPAITMMAGGAVTVRLAQIAHDDGTPRLAFLQAANHAFDAAEKRNAGNPSYHPSTLQMSPGTGPESDSLSGCPDHPRRERRPYVLTRSAGGHYGRNCRRPAA